MLDNYQDLIEELLGTPKLVRELLANGASPEALALVVEIRDRDVTVLDRLQRMTRQQDAYLRALPSIDELAANRSGSGDDRDEVLSSLDTARGDLVSLLMNLTLKDWERTGTHEILGEVTVAEEVEEHVEFDEAHLDGIKAAAL
jgi:hypothetical protein